MMRNDHGKASPKRRLGGGLLLLAPAVDNFEEAARIVTRLEGGVECTLTRFLELLGRNAPEKLAKMALNGHAGEHSPPKSRHKNSRPGAFSAPAN